MGADPVGLGGSVWYVAAHVQRIHNAVCGVDLQAVSFSSQHSPCSKASPSQQRTLTASKLHSCSPVSSCASVLRSQT